ncbi:pyrazinamidase nicotinamidase [Pyrenophora tritici-repentis]|nr:pyrazinamidase nicotinamidase [Pyrenophora tritici-repentis]
MQEDFCPPDGALAVTGGRDIVPTINEFLEYPFALKVATKDYYHPRATFPSRPTTQRRTISHSSPQSQSRTRITQRRRRKRAYGRTTAFKAGSRLCVKYTAIDAQKEGFKTWVVSDAVKAVDPSSMDDVHKEYTEIGVTVIGKGDAQMQKVRDLM